MRLRNRSFPMTRDVMQEIEQEIAANPVILYMKGTKEMPMCGFSAAVVQVLKDVGAEFKDVNVLADPDKREAIKRFSDWPTLPQLYVGGQFVGGCDIVREMQNKGELEPLVRAALG